MSHPLLRIATKITGLAVVAALATGWTDCANFEPVTVPATDATRPIAFLGVNQGGSWLDSTVDGPMTYHMTLGQRAFAVGAGIDNGGLASLTMYSGESWTCCKGRLCSRSSTSSVPQTDTQAGGVGSTVSNGIYLYSLVVLPTCGTGWTLRDFNHGWYVVATDFHGNTTTSSGGAMVYP